MNYSMPKILVYNADDVREFQAIAGSASCTSNSGTSCGTNVCICVSFSCVIKK